MKAIFRNLFVIMSVLTMTMGFISCSDDEDFDSIVGPWAYEEKGYYEEITFKSNGTFIIESEEYYRDEWDSYTDKGSYELDGNKLIVFIDDEISIVTIVSLTSTKLVLIDDEGDSITYYRV